MINDFHKPSSAEEAVKIKREKGHSFYLGGGTKLNNGGEINKAESYISLENIGLKGIIKTGDKIKVGALETLQKLIDSPAIPEFIKAGALGESNRNIRNASTVGGTIASGKSYSTVLASLIAVDAEVETAEEGMLSVNEYVKSGMNSLILAVYLPVSDVKLYQNNQRKTANSRPEIIVAASVEKSSDSVSRAILVLGGISDRPIRLEKVENKLIDGSLKDADSVQDAVMDEIISLTEKKENGVYLNYISGVMAADCVGRCMRS